MKSFVALLVVALVLGGGLGGAFAAGFSVGKNQVEAPASNTASVQPTATPQFPVPGELSPEQLEQFRQQFQDSGGAGFGGGFRGGGDFGGGGGGGFGGRGGLTGTIESVDGNTLTIDSPAGLLTATLGITTTIQTTVEGSMDDLQVGTRVSVVGQPGEDGTIVAQSVTVIPEGSGGFLGDGGFIQP